ncbi:MAG: hypothetical protein AAFO63_03790 [Pseudomonadota bacterium]
MPEFDKNAAYLWAIISLGLALPTLLIAYSHVRLALARRRLERLRKAEAET